MVLPVLQTGRATLFTGLIQDVGDIAAIKKQDDGGLELSVSPRSLDVASFEIGESVAINGVCLTVTEASGGTFRVTAGGETQKRTTLDGYRAGLAVNLERALRVGDRLGGHIVQGHVDGIAHLIAKRQDLLPISN